MTIAAVGVELPPVTPEDASSPRADRAVFGSDAARRLLERHGLDSLDRLFDLGRPVAARHAGRCVFDRTVKDDAGRSARLFVKLQHGRRRLWPRMNEIRTGQMFQTLAEREWSGIQSLERLRIAVPERLALFGTSPWSLSYRAAVVVREVRPRLSLDEMLRGGQWNWLSRTDQDHILDAVVSTLGTIHAAGLGWRGASSRHFFPERRGDGLWTVWLIDCEGIHRFARRRTFERNFDKLVRACRESLADADTLGRLQSRIEEHLAGGGSVRQRAA